MKSQVQILQENTEALDISLNNFCNLFAEYNNEITNKFKSFFNKTENIDTIDYDSILSVCYDSIDDFYTENNINNFITYDEISAEVAEYEQQNGEIYLDLDSDTRDIDIANTIKNGYRIGQLDMHLIENYAKNIIPSDISKIKTGIDENSPDISEFLNHSYCTPTNTYISHCDEFFTLYNRILDTIQNEATDENKTLELLGYTYGLNNDDDAITREILNYIKFFEIHKDDLSVVVNDVKPTVSIDTNRVFLKSVVSDNTNAITAHDIAEEIKEAVNNTSSGETPFTFYYRLCDLYNEIKECMNSIKNSIASILESMEFGEFATATALLEYVRRIASGEASNDFSSSFVKFTKSGKNLINLIKQTEGANHRVLKKLLKEIGKEIIEVLEEYIVAWFKFFFTTPTGLIIVAIAILIMYILFIRKDRRDYSRPIEIAKRLTKNIINASKKLNGYAKKISDPLVKNIKKDLEHHTKKVKIIVDDGINSISENTNISFLDSHLSILQNNVDNMIDTDYKVSENKDKYHGTYYGINAGIFELVGFSISELVEKYRKYVNVTELDIIEIQAYPVVEPSLTCPICGKPIGDEDDDHCTGYEAHDIQYEIVEYHGPIELYIDKDNDVRYTGEGSSIENAIGWALAKAYTLIDGEKVYLPDHNKYGPIGSDVPYDEWDLDPDALKTITLPSVSEINIPGNENIPDIVIHVENWKLISQPGKGTEVEPGGIFTLNDEYTHEYIRTDDEPYNCTNCNSGLPICQFEAVGSISINH